MRKHINNKHADKVASVRKSVEFFNNFLRDPRRKLLPVVALPARRPVRSAALAAAVGGLQYTYPHRVPTGNK